MVGAVFHQEMMLAGRRVRLQILRWAYAGWLVLQTAWFYVAFQADWLGRSLPFSGVTEGVSLRFAAAFVEQQAILVLLLTPALAAGAIADEKRNGTLQHLFLTEMESRHFVLGKLLARALQVLLVLLAGLPLFALMAGFAGLPPLTVFLAGASLVPALAGLVSLSLLASVWCRQTRDAVLALYAAILAGVLLVRFGGTMRLLDPFFVLEPAWGASGTRDLGEAWSRLGWNAAAWGGVAAGCLLLAVARLRPACLAQAQGSRKPRWYAPAREAVEDDPIAWRERHVEGLAPNALLRAIPQWLGIILLAAISTASCLCILGASLVAGATLADLCRAILALDVRRVAALMPEASFGFLVQGVAAMLLFSLAVGVRCSGAVSSEREARTWEALLLTPQTERQIIHGKLWGVMGASYPYLLAYATPALSLSVLAGPLGFAYAAAWSAATVLAMHFIGAAGLWCSVRAGGSWRALAQTIVVGYAGGLAIYAICSPGLFVLLGVLLLALALIDLACGTLMAATCLYDSDNLLRAVWLCSAAGLAIIFAVVARQLLHLARSWVAERERTRHREDERFIQHGPW